MAPGSSQPGLRPPPDRLPSTGRLVELLALAHAGVGLAAYRPELRSIVRRGVVGTVSLRGTRSNAFWFLAPSPPLWMAGRLLRVAQQAGDDRALRAVHGVGVVAAAVGVVCMPVSGFWGWLALSLRGLRETSKTHG